MLKLHLLIPKVCFFYNLVVDHLVTDYIYGNAKVSLKSFATKRKKISTKVNLMERSTSLLEYNFI